MPKHKEDELFVGRKTLCDRMTGAGVMTAALLVFLCAAAVAAVPDDAKREFNRGIEFSKAKKLDSAIVAYEAAIKIAPDYLDAQINIGALYYEKGDLAKATEIKAMYREIRSHMRRNDMRIRRRVSGKYGRKQREKVKQILHHAS